MGQALLPRRACPRQAHLPEYSPHPQQKKNFLCWGKNKPDIKIKFPIHNKRKTRIPTNVVFISMGEFGVPNQIKFNLINAAEIKAKTAAI